MAYFKRVHPFLQFLIFIGVAFGIFILVTFIGAIVLSAITGVSIIKISDPANLDFNDPKTLTVERGLLVIQFIGLFVIPSFLFARLCDTKTVHWLGLKPANRLYYLLGIIVLIIALPLVNWAGVINNELIPETTAIGKWMKASEETAQKHTAFMLQRRGIQDIFINLVFVAVFAGVGEELFFRGVLQRIFIKMFKSPWAGIIVAAFVFSAGHVQFYGFIPRIILGILLGAIYWYSGSLWPAIVAHFAYDAFAVVMIYFKPEMADNDQMNASMGNLVVWAIISAAIVIGIMIIMKKRSTTTYEMMYARDNIDDSNPFANSSFT